MSPERSTRSSLEATIIKMGLEQKSEILDHTLLLQAAEAR